MKAKAHCKVCARTVPRRRNGALGKHWVKVYDGWGGKLATHIGTARPPATGFPRLALLENKGLTSSGLDLVKQSRT